MHNLATVLSVILKELCLQNTLQNSNQFKNAVLPIWSGVISAVPYGGKGIAASNHLNKDVDCTG